MAWGKGGVVMKRGRKNRDDMKKQNGVLEGGSADVH
jgi:hypothetical protein